MIPNMITPETREMMADFKNFQTFESNCFGLSGDHSEINTPTNLKPQFMFGETTKFGVTNDDHFTQSINNKKPLL
jgi:hypothetical protein